MAKKEFSLGESLAAALGTVSDPDQSEQITYLDISALDADADNFYSMEGIAELAENIELIGLQQPLRVRENPDMPGRYLIVSGHRRRAAIWTLYEENPDKWAKVACIIEKAAGCAELQELRLIMANADTRRMSSADLAKQVERVQMLLYKLKEQGYEFPGRMRDHVAEACNVSGTKIAMLKVIQEKLHPLIKKYWEDGKINETVAYTIASAPERVQQQLCSMVGADRIGDGYTTEYQIKWKIDYMRALDEQICKATGEPCEHAEVLLENKFVKFKNRYCDCEYQKCCAKCPKLGTCRTVCPQAADAQKQLQEQARQRKAEEQKREAEEARQRAKRAEEQRRIDAVEWSRLLRAVEAAGEKPIALLEVLGAVRMAWASDTLDNAVEELKRRAIGSWNNDTDGQGIVEDSPNYYFDDMDTILQTAQLLECSTDYLLGRTDVMAPTGGEWINVDDRYPEEGQYVWAVDDWNVPMPSVYFHASFMEIESKNVATRRLQHIEHWMPMPAPPKGKVWHSEETIREMVSGK